MYFIESPHEDTLIEDYQTKKIDMMKRAMEQEVGPAMNKTEVGEMMKAWMEKAMELESLNPGEKKWTKLRSYSFACETGATIGRGGCLRAKVKKIKICVSQCDLMAHLGPITLKNPWSIF